MQNRRLSHSGASEDLGTAAPKCPHSHRPLKKLLDMPMSEFSMRLKCVWDKATEKFERLMPAAAQAK